MLIIFDDQPLVIESACYLTMAYYINKSLIKVYWINEKLI